MDARKRLSLDLDRAREDPWAAPDSADVIAASPEVPPLALDWPGDPQAPVTCAYPPCGQTLPLCEARGSYKTCHNCYTYYCCRHCRRLHWSEHKQHCHLSQVNSACKHVIKHVNRQPQLQYSFSRFARRGYLTQGRGCVMLGLRDLAAARDFLQRGVAALHLTPIYVTVKELRRSRMFGDVLPQLVQMCGDYNPEVKYILHVGVGVARPASASDGSGSGDVTPSPLLELCPSPNGGGSVFGADPSPGAECPYVETPRTPEGPAVDSGGGRQGECSHGSLGRNGSGGRNESLGRNGSLGRDGKVRAACVDSRCDGKLTSSSSSTNLTHTARVPGGLLRRHASCRECGRDSARQNGRVSFAPGTRDCPPDKPPITRSQSLSTSSGSLSARHRGSRGGSSSAVPGVDSSSAHTNAGADTLPGRRPCHHEDRRGSGGFEFGSGSSAADMRSPGSGDVTLLPGGDVSCSLGIPRSVSAEAGFHGNDKDDDDDDDDEVGSRRSSSGYGSLRHDSGRSSDRLDSLTSAGSLQQARMRAEAAPRKSGPILQKCAKLRLSAAHMHPASPLEEHSTLILTASHGAARGGDSRKDREVSFISIQRKLRQRGVSLRHQFPDVYSRLIDFVADGRHFPPEIIYPPDMRTGRPFMCVIMPESEPDIEWLQGPDLVHELDLSSDDLTTPRM